MSKYFETVLDELAQIPSKDRSTDVLKQHLPYSDYMISKCKSDSLVPAG